MSVKDIDLEKIFNKVAEKGNTYDYIFKEFILDFGEILIDEVYKELEEIKLQFKND